MKSSNFDNKVIRINNNNWKFPKKIAFGSASNYDVNIDSIDFNNTGLFIITTLAILSLVPLSYLLFLITDKFFSWQPVIYIIR